METPYVKFRLSPDTLAALDSLAASAGSRSQAVRESAAYWHAAIADAGRLNAEELSREDWERLAHLNDPTPIVSENRDAAIDWSTRLAIELVGMWEGRSVVLPLHKAEAAACRKLARRIGSWGPVRGYALFACLRYFWRCEETPAQWWAPEAWMTLAGGSDDE